MCTDSHNVQFRVLSAIHVDGSMFGLPWALAYRNVAKDFATGRVRVASALVGTSTRGMLRCWQFCRPRSATVPAWGYNQLGGGFKRGCQRVFTPVSLGYPLSVFNKNSTLKHADKLFKSLSRGSHKKKAPGRSPVRNSLFSGKPGIGFKTKIIVVSCWLKPPCFLNLSFVFSPTHAHLHCLVDWLRNKESLPMEPGPWLCAAYIYTSLLLTMVCSLDAHFQVRNQLITSWCVYQVREKNWY